MLKFNGHDPLGKLIWDYHSGKKDIEVDVLSNLSDPDIIPGEYLFRTFKKMPELEQKALKKVSGNILDIGAAAGCHSKYLIEKGFEIDAIDISPGAVAWLQSNNYPAKQANFFDFTTNKQYDTLLMLMNGIGICGRIYELGRFFVKVDELLKPGGQLIFDSSDLQYIFSEANEKVLKNLSPNYYGEVIYQMKYGDQKSKKFHWLFIDFLTIQEWAEAYGFKCEKIADGPHFDYLARIIKPLK